MVTMCSTCRASFICSTVNSCIDSLSFLLPWSFPTKFIRPEDYQSARCTSAPYKLLECFYFPLLPNCSSGSKDMAVSRLNGSPLKSRELGGGYYFSDDMEHILWPKPMAPRAINGLLICKRHFHWPPAWLRALWSESLIRHFRVPLLSLPQRIMLLFPLCLPSEPGGKVFGRFKRAYISTDSYFSSRWRGSEH